jgi:uncharacterized membrane protein YfcA
MHFTQTVFLWALAGLLCGVLSSALFGRKARARYTRTAVILGGGLLGLVLGGTAFHALSVETALAVVAGLVGSLVLVLLFRRVTGPHLDAGPDNPPPTPDERARILSEATTQPPRRVVTRP